MGAPSTGDDIMATEPTNQPNSDLTTTLQPPRDGTKQAKLVGLLSRKNGITLTKAAEALGWQRHTTSAAMTGLRKRGYDISRTARPDKDSLYRIVASETSS